MPFVTYKDWDYDHSNKKVYAYLAAALAVSTLLLIEKPREKEVLIDFDNFIRIKNHTLPQLKNKKRSDIAGWKHKKLLIEKRGYVIPCTANIPKWMDTDSDRYMLKTIYNDWWYSKDYADVYNEAETVKFIKSCVPVYNEFIKNH